MKESDFSKVDRGSWALRLDMERNQEDGQRYMLRCDKCLNANQDANVRLKLHTEPAVYSLVSKGHCSWDCPHLGSPYRRGEIIVCDCSKYRVWVKVSEVSRHFAVRDHYCLIDEVRKGNGTDTPAKDTEDNHSLKSVSGFYGLSKWLDANGLELQFSERVKNGSLVFVRSYDFGYALKDNVIVTGYGVHDDNAIYDLCTQIVGCLIDFCDESFSIRVPEDLLTSRPCTDLNEWLSRNHIELEFLSCNVASLLTNSGSITIHFGRRDLSAKNITDDFVKEIRGKNLIIPGGTKWKSYLAVPEDLVYNPSDK